MSTLEQHFLLSLIARRVVLPLREYRFDPERGWCFDFAYPALKLAVELEGVFGCERSRHTDPVGYADDCIKYNAAILAGWTVLRYTAREVESGDAGAEVERVLVERLGEAAYAGSTQAQAGGGEAPAVRPRRRRRTVGEQVKVGEAEGRVVAEWPRR